MFRFALRVKAILNSASLVHRLQDHVTPFRPNNHFYLVSNDLNMTWIIIRKNSLMISETAANIVSRILYEYPYSIQRWADPLILCNDFAHYAGTRRRQSLVRSDLVWQDGHAQYEHRTKHTESSAHTDAHTSGRVEGPILCFLSEKHHRLYTADISLCCLRRRRDEKRSLMYNSDLWETLKSLHNIRIMQQVSLRAPFSLFNLGQSLFEKSEKSPSSDI